MRLKTIDNNKKITVFLPNFRKEKMPSQNMKQKTSNAIQNQTYFWLNNSEVEKWQETMICL